MTALDSTAESLLRDPQYLLRLYHKISSSLVKCDHSTYARSLSRAFVEMDARYRLRAHVQMVEFRLLKGILRQVFPAKSLGDRELSIFLAMLPLDEYGEGGIRGESGEDGGLCVTPVTLMRCLRHTFPFRALLLHTMLHAMDALPRRPHPSESSCGMALAESIRKSEGNVCTLDTGVIIDYLTQSFDLTISEAFFLIDYCASGDMSTSGVSVAVDGAYLYTLLYQRPLPADVHFPLLLSVFTEAVGDLNREGRSGTLALVEELGRVPLEPGVGGGGAAPVEDNMCIDIGADMANRYLTLESFEKLCKALRVGMAVEDVRRLFYYLGEGGSCGAVRVRTLVEGFLRHLTPVGESLFGIVEEAVRRYIVKAGGMLALARLHLALPDGVLSIAAFVGALREAGVPDVVSDVELEWLRFKGRDKVQLVRLLSGRLPSNREALVKQLFDQIKSAGNAANGNVGVHVEQVLTHFHPEKGGEALVGSGDEWRRMMSRFFREKMSETLTQDHFIYFWRTVSAACSDDSVFTMILWRCFSMHTSRRF